MIWRRLRLHSTCYHCTPFKIFANTRISPGFMKPLTPRRHIEPKTPRKGGDSIKSPENKLPRIPSTRIPATPYQEVHDEFWDQEITDKWNEEHSPRKGRLGSSKPIFISLDGSNSNSESESECDSDNWIVNDDQYRTPRKTGTKPTKKAPGTVVRALKKDWEAKKNAMAWKFVQDMDREVEDGAVGKYYADKGGIRLEWNPRLRTTAGRALMVSGVIELSPKVITSEGKLTLFQKLCGAEVD
jgi:hypothetical protein